VVVALAVGACAVGCELPDKGTVAAMSIDGGRVIAEKRCRQKGDTYDYVSCGKQLRAAVEHKLCAELGRGKHPYLYRTGESDPIETAVECD
jgi:hypothetical protein